MEYKLIRSKRKTVCMQLDCNGQVVVRAPLYMREADITLFVNRHSDWLAKQLARRTPPKRFSDGENVEICGANYIIATGSHTKLADNILYLPCVKREEALAQMLRKITRERMLRLLDEICAVSGLSYHSLKVTSARSRWGSCNSKHGIAFTFRTAFLPDALAEYLAVHELCHTIYMNHSEKFWKVVERFIPDYKVRRAALKGYHWAMNCL